MLGDMLHIDIQNGEKAVKASKFQQDIKGTEVCMKRLIMATKRCRQLTSNDAYFSDIWFSGVKMVD